MRFPSGTGNIRSGLHGSGGDAVYPVCPMILRKYAVSVFLTICCPHSDRKSLYRCKRWGLQTPVHVRVMTPAGELLRAMLESGVSEELRVALVNAALLALWAVLPGLLLGAARQSSAARRMRPDFSLRRSEAMELDRALLIYEKACGRLKEITDQTDNDNGWRRVLGLRVDPDRQHADEFDDLDTHVQHLRGTIIRLKRQPLQRLRSWVHTLSLQFALSGAAAAHMVCFALLMAALYASWADKLAVSMRNPLVWYPLDERLFYANAVASIIAALSAPVFFLVRWARLRREYSVELCALKELAVIDPSQARDQLQFERADQQRSHQDANDGEHDNSGFAVLGLPQSATEDQVREAYKTLIKQSHPDRVQGMSLAFTKLAEAETKKLNAAYQHALVFLRSNQGKAQRQIL